MLAWPAYARIALSGARLSWRGPVRRVELDDGMARQARSGRAMQRVIDCTALIDDDADRDRFDAWAASLDDWFLLPASASPEDTPRLARIAGGRGGVAWTQEAGRGRTRWRASLQLESPEAFRYRDLWDPLLPVGDLSHVYARRTFASPAWTQSSPGVWWLTLPLFPGAPRLPVSWQRTADPVYFTQAAIRPRGPGAAAAIRGRVDLSADPSVRGPAMGPDIGGYLLTGLGWCLRSAAGARLAIRWFPGDVTDAADPYSFGVGDVAEAHAWLTAARTGGGAISFALVWMGAGSVVDLDDFTSIPIGRAVV